MVARRIALAGCLAFTLAFVPSRALADDDALGKARTAISQVRYDEAQTLLVEALRGGTSSPVDLAEIYRLSASTAIVLGQADVAEQYFRRWLALVPTASLPESVAPKLRQPFVSAQAYMAAHGRLSVKAQRRGDVIDVVVESDPLGMVASVTLGDGRPRTIGADRVVHLDLASGDAGGDVRVLDEFGNRLIELKSADIPIGETEPRVDGPASQALPLYRRPLPWGIGAAAFAAGGIAFGLVARSAQGDVVAISMNPDAHFASELDDAKDRRDRAALLANIGLVAAGACAVTAAVMWATQPRATVVVAPTADGAAVTLSTAF